MLKQIMTASNKSWKPRYFDIGVNFSDPMFRGIYQGKQRHDGDLDQVIDRAHTFNVDKMLITASTLQESRDHLKLCEKYPGKFYSTAGVHPCSVAREFYNKSENEGYSEELRADIDDLLLDLKNTIELGVSQGFIKAFGEIGLDYDRFHYSSENQQKVMFKKQLQLLASLKHLKLPLFLHMRAACHDFISILKPFIEDGSIQKGNGVVHSFTGTQEELDQLIELGFYISVNGCSLRDPESLPVAANIPRDRLLIETDAPWCEVKRTHASYQYLTPYPNKFYPKAITNKETEEIPESPSDDIPNKSHSDTNKPKKQQNVSKKNLPTYHEFLPYPSIKKENFGKHFSKIDEKLKDLPDSDSVDRTVGEFSHPLIKSRNEPVFVGLIAETMCNLYGIKDDQEIEDLIDQVYLNSCKLFNV